MTGAASWSHFLARQSRRPPLAFVNGMRVGVERGICCHVHSHDRAFEIVHHPSNRGVARVAQRREIAFSSGSVVIHAPGEPHDQVMTVPGVDFCVHVAAPTRGRDVPASSLYVPPLTDATLIEDIRLLSQSPPARTGVEQAVLNLRATALLLSLIQLACARRDEETTDPALRHVLKAEQYMGARFATIKSLREVAAHVGLSADHLRHCFQAIRGKSMVRYLNELRIDRARTLLVHSRLPLKQISAMCGFGDEYYFSTVFRRLTRTTPGRYRNS
jgi:AraC-like DNA-binding protein